MCRVPWWAVLSAVLAPVFLIGGWSLGATLQPPGYDWVRDTLSSLASVGATDRAVMTISLAGLGVCFLVTALGLRPAELAGRGVLAIGGAATLVVVAFPLPASGTSETHGTFAGIAFVSLVLWPALAWRRGRTTPWALRPAVSITATLALLALLIAFVTQLFSHGQYIGLTERVLAGAQALWPLVVVLTARRLVIARSDRFWTAADDSGVAQGGGESRSRPGRNG